MPHAVATAAAWAFVLLCTALWRSGSFRAAAPVLAGPWPARAALPPQAREDERGEEDRDVSPERRKASRRFPAPLPLACAVAATALLRVGLFFALGR